MTLKKGRPPDSSKAKARVRSIVLSQKAHIYLQREIKRRGGNTKWINEWISHIIIKEFPEDNYEYLLRKLLQYQEERKIAEEKVLEAAKAYGDEKAKREKNQSPNSNSINILDCDEP